MRYPWDRVSGNRRLMRGLIAASVVSFVALSAVDWPTHTSEAPSGQISLQFAADNETALAIVDSWESAGVLHLAGASVGLDYVWIIAYGLTLSLAGARLAKRASNAGRAPWMIAGALAAWAGVLAAFADGIEGVLLLILIGDAASGPAAATTALATTKFTLIAISLVVSSVGVFAVPRTAERV